MHFCISASTSPVVVIDVLDFIGPSDPFWGCNVSAKDVLAKLRANPTAEAVELNINSGGGDVFEGFAMIDALTAFGKPVTVNIVGVCGSMASVLAMVGEVRNMSPNAMFMIHNPAGGMFGDDEDHLKFAALIAMQRERMLDLYEQHAKASRKELTAMMADETWLDAKGAKKLGFITDIVARIVSPDGAESDPELDPSEYSIAARADLSRCAKVPSKLIAARLAPTKKISQHKVPGALAPNQSVRAAIASAPKESPLMNLAELIKMLGLPEAATEADVMAALAARLAPVATPAPAPVLETPASVPSELPALAASLQVRLEASEKQSRAFAVEMTAMKERERVGQVKAILAANRSKCTPALEAYLVTKSPEEVTTILSGIVASTSPAQPPRVEGQDPPSVTNMTLTAEDRAICKMFGTSETEFLKAKAAIAASPRVQWENTARAGE